MRTRFNLMRRGNLRTGSVPHFVISKSAAQNGIAFDSGTFPIWPFTLLQISMKTFPVVLAIACELLAQNTFASSVDLAKHPQGIWSIAGTKNEKRWVIIHNLEEAQTSGIYHIEVIQKALDAPNWKVIRLIKHMAITADALRRSIDKPLNTGAVYPESFDDGLAKWKAQNGGKGGIVCKSSVLECAKSR